MTIRVPLRVRQRWAINLSFDYPQPPTQEQWISIIEAIIDDVSDYAEPEDDGCPC